MSSTYRELYDRGARLLVNAGICDYAIDSRLLLEYVCSTDRNYLLAHGDNEVDSEKESEYLELIEKRCKHIPLQHLTKEQEFMGLRFMVNENVLIPRQDTECLVEEVMCDMGDGLRVLDMCTGSGCIIISLSKYKNDYEAVGVDVSEKALEVARKNAALNEVKVDFVLSDLFAGLDINNKFDVIVSNPPYIESDVVDTLMPEVKDYEPRMALDGDSDGLKYYRLITEEAACYLNPGGSLYYEIGYNQAEAVKNIMEKSGFTDVCVVKDLAGLDRVVKGRKKCLIN